MKLNRNKSKQLLSVEKVCLKQYNESVNGANIY